MPKRKSTVLLVLAIALLCASCGSNRLHYDKHLEPQYIETDPESANVYLIREHHLLHSGEIWTIDISGKGSIWLVDESYRTIHLPPAEYTFSTSGPFGSEIKMNLEAGQTYYIKISDEDFLDFELIVIPAQEAHRLIESKKVYYVEPTRD